VPKCKQALVFFFTYFSCLTSSLLYLWCWYDHVRIFINCLFFSAL